MCCELICVNFVNVIIRIDSCLEFLLLHIGRI